MMLSVVLFLRIVQLVAAEKALSPQVVIGALGTCPPQHMRDLARQNLSLSILNIIAGNDIPATHPCGSGQWIRVAYLNMSDPLQQQCPPSWRLYLQC